MHIIERWGTGIPRIFTETAEYGLQELELKDFGTSFRIDIFRKPFETDAFGMVSPGTEGYSQSATQKGKPDLNPADRVRAMIWICESIKHGSE